MKKNMHIKNVKDAQKIISVSLNTDEMDPNHIKFKWLTENKKILKDKAGRVYIMTVNDIVVKIGGSIAEGGIKTGTMNFYETAMTGRPNESRYGIHLFMKRELEQRNRVDVYLLVNNSVSMNIQGLFGNKKKVLISEFKKMEKQCINDYRSIVGRAPVWNLQENGDKWPDYVRTGCAKLKAKVKRRK